MCYVRIRIITNEDLEYEYGCVEYSVHFLNLREECLAGPSVSNFSSMQCCNNTDRCNEHLMPSPPHLFAAFRTTTSPVQDPTSSETGKKLEYKPWTFQGL